MSVKTSMNTSRVKRDKTVKAQSSAKNLSHIGFVSYKYILLLGPSVKSISLSSTIFFYFPSFRRFSSLYFIIYPCIMLSISCKF